MSRAMDWSPVVHRRAIRVTAGFVLLWGIWTVLQLGYVLFRGTGDDLSEPRNIQAIEESVFFGNPAEWLQHSIYENGAIWLDFASFVAHGFWFGLPFGLGLALMLYRRPLLMEFLVWTSVVSYVCVAIFMVFPVDPPWMHADVVRVLSERDFADYTAVDTNPSAAFPSMHAALPAAMALFFFLRYPERSLYAWLCLFFALAIGFSVVYLGEHWVIDVLAGYAAAAVTALLCSRRLVAQYRRLPGDPVGRAQALNAWFFVPPGRAEVQRQEHRVLPRAA